MVPLHLFANPLFAGANLLTLLLYGSFAGTLFVIPYTLIALYGYSATRVGLALLPLGLSIGFLTRFFGIVGDRYGARGPLICGTFLVAAATAWLAWTQAAGNYSIGTFGPILGLAIGMAIVICGAACGRSYRSNQGLRVCDPTESRNGSNASAGGSGRRDCVKRPSPARSPIPQNLSADTAAGLRHAIDSAYGSAFGYAMALNLSLACAALLVALCCRQACVIRELAAV